MTNKALVFGPYSPIKSAEGFSFISGQVGVDPQTKESAKDIKSQTSQALVNLQAVLETHGMQMQDVVKTTVFLTDMDDFSDFNEIYEGFFVAPRPARSTVAVKELPRLGSSKLRVEIEAVAYNKANQ